MSLNTHNLERSGYIIYYDWKIGGFTIDEWLIHWTWLYFINEIDIEEYQLRIDYVKPEMPGALDQERWEPLVKYLVSFN